MKSILSLVALVGALWNTSAFAFSQDCSWGAPYLEDVSTEFLGVGEPAHGDAYLIDEVDELDLRPGESWASAIQRAAGIFGAGSITEMNGSEWELRYVLGRATEELATSSQSLAEFEKTIRCAGAGSDRALFWGQYKAETDSGTFQGSYIAVLEKSKRRVLLLGSGLFY